MSERLNIKNMTPEPEKRPEKNSSELSSEERQTIADQREGYRQENNWYSFSELATLELARGEDVPVSSEERAAIADKRERARQRNDWYAFSRFATFEIILARREADSSPADNQDIPPRPQARNF